MDQRRILPALLSAIYLFFATLSGALAEQAWRYGDAIPLTCLNRTIETGEHVGFAVPPNTTATS